MKQYHAYGEQNIICPFYQGEDKNNIYCEGLCEGTQNVSFFNTPTEKKTYKINYCNREAHWDCPYYKILDEIRYQEDNMGKSAEEKLDGATRKIRELVKEKKAVEREVNALNYQVDWRERKLQKAQAEVESTEMLTKYLIYKIAGTDELRVSVKEMAKYLTQYDMIATQDKKTNEIVCTLVDKKANKILEKNYNEYQEYCEQYAKDNYPKKTYSNFIRIKEPGKRDNKEKIISDGINAMRAEALAMFPEKLKKKLKIDVKVFNNYKGTFLIAWFAVEK